MTIGLIKCTEDNLVALVPKVVSKLRSENFELVFEKGAGIDSGYKDQEYIDAGAVLLSRKEILESANVIVSVSGVSSEDLSSINADAYLIGKFNLNQELISKFEQEKFKTLSLDRLPRSSFAQSMDVLSSLASLSGYKAVICAADHFAGYLPMMTTSAGTIPPAKVLVLGAGVAGLQAIATAKRLGAVVEAFDVRSSVKEEVQSLGAKFIEVEGSNEDKDAGGYAIEQSSDYEARQKELIHQSAMKADIIVTTAAIPGKKAPILIEERTVSEMKQGSVIVDLAASSGGNSEVTKDATTIDYDGVKIVGDSRLYNQMGTQASLVFSNNLYSFMKFIFKDGLENIPFDNEIVSKTLISQHKEKSVTA